MSPLYTLPAPAGYRAHPTTGLLLDDRSGELIQSGKYQMAIPTTDAELVAQGWPSIAGAVDGDLWLCDEAAGNLVGKINGYQLAPTGGPLQNRDFHGLPYGGNLWAKKATETMGAGTLRFADATVGELQVGLNDFSVSVLIRAQSRTLNPGFNTQHLVGKRSIIAPLYGWELLGYGAGGWTVALGINDNTGFSFIDSGRTFYDGALHLVSMSVDRNGNVAFYIDGTATVNVAAARPGDLTTNDIGFSSHAADYASAFDGQIAWIYHVIGTTMARVGHDALWAALSSSHLGTANTYARANPLTTRIEHLFGRVATAAANAFMPGYNTNASAGDNPLELGVVCEDGASFLGLGTTNMPAFVGTNAAVTATDGPSGMRDAARVADTDGVNAGYATSGSANLVGATNVSHVYSAYVKSGGVGVNAAYLSYYTGDAGGPETFTNWTIAGAVGAVWRPFIGLAHTPTRPAHTAVVVRLYPTDTVAASLGTVDFAEVWGRANATADRATWRRAAAGAASATSTPSLSYTNVGNARYSPTRGRLTARVCGWAKKEEALVGTYAAGNDASGVAFDGTNVWITHAGGAATVRKLIAATGALVADYATQNTPVGVCYDSTQGRIWTGNNASNSVTALVAATGALVGNYASGGNGAYGVCFDGAQNAIWCVNMGSNSVTKFNAATGAVIGTYAVGVAPAGVCYDSVQNAVWICNQTSATVTKLNAATGALIGAYATGAGPLWAAYDNVNNRIWTTNNTAGSITILNAATGALVATIAAVIDTDLRGISFDGVNMWIGAGTAQTVRKYVAATWAFAGAYSVGGASKSNAWDGVNNCIWQAESTSDNIRKIGARQVFLAFGAEAAQGALWLDYAGDWTASPLCGVAPQLRLRMWDDAAALVCDLDCGALTAAEAIRTIEWNAIVGKVGVLNGATVLASHAGAWTPETAVAVAPLYVGSDPTPANAAGCYIEVVDLKDY